MSAPTLQEREEQKAKIRAAADFFALYLDRRTGKVNATKVRQEFERLRAEVAALRGFAQAVMECWPDGDVEGGYLQDAAVKFGLLAPVTVYAPCGYPCACAEYHGTDAMADGVECFRRSALLSGGGK